MAPFPFSVQRDIVVACFADHNFIRKCDIHDELFMAFEENNAQAQGGKMMAKTYTIWNGVHKEMNTWIICVTRLRINWGEIKFVGFYLDFSMILWI